MLRKTNPSCAPLCALCAGLCAGLCMHFACALALCAGLVLCLRACSPVAIILCAQVDRQTGVDLCASGGCAQLCAAKELGVFSLVCFVFFLSAHFVRLPAWPVPTKSSPAKPMLNSATPAQILWKVYLVDHMQLLRKSYQILRKPQLTLSKSQKIQYKSFLR